MWMRNCAVPRGGPWHLLAFFCILNPHPPGVKCQSARGPPGHEASGTWHSLALPGVGGPAKGQRATCRSAPGPAGHTGSCHPLASPCALGRCAAHRHGLPGQRATGPEGHRAKGHGRFEPRPGSRARSLVAPGPRRGALDSVPRRRGRPPSGGLRATWQAGRQIGRERNRSRCTHLRAATELPASLPSGGSGPFFPKSLAPFPRFALDHTHNECRRAPPRAVGPWKAPTGPGAS